MTAHVITPDDTGILLAVFVPGHPRTKGSLKVITPRGKRPIMVEDHALSKPWRTKIRKTIHAECPAYRKLGHVPEAGAVMVTLVFRFERPETGMGVDLPWPIINGGINANGDYDKLLRNVLDALQDAKVIKNDAQVVGSSGIKRWANPGEAAGVEIVVTSV